MTETCSKRLKKKNVRSLCVVFVLPALLVINTTGRCCTNTAPTVVAYTLPPCYDEVMLQVLHTVAYQQHVYCRGIHLVKNTSYTFAIDLIPVSVTLHLRGICRVVTANSAHGNMYTVFILNKSGEVNNLSHRCTRNVCS
jgi:hypothetical protein